MLFLGTLALFCPVKSQDFVGYDDGAYVTNNPLVTQGVSWKGLGDAFVTLNAGTSYWHPLTWISHQIDYALFGTEAGWHKLVNLVFHCHNSLLLFGLLYRLRPSIGFSLSVAALFAWHPLHVESVVWVSERKDVLSTFFGLLAFHCYLNYRAAPSFRRYGLLVLVFACSLMSKPMLVTFPVLLLFLDFWLPRTQTTGFQVPCQWRELLWEKGPLFLMSLGICVVTLVAQNDLNILATTVEVPVAVRVANALQSYWFYAVKLVVPLGLAVRYPYPTEFASFSVCWSLVFFVGVSAVAYKARFRCPYFGFGWAWYVVSLLPVIGLIQAGMQSRADRYTYLPLIGLCVAIVWGLDEWIVSRRRMVFSVIAVGVSLFFIPLTWRQIGFWKDSRTLFSRAVAVTEHNALMHRALAENLDWQQEPEEASRHYRLAMECPREDPGVYESAARFFRARRDLERELLFLRKALIWMPKDLEALNRIAYLLATHPDSTVRKPSEAIRLSTLACFYDTSNAAVYRQTRAAALAADGDFQSAIRVAERALKGLHGASARGFQRRLNLYRQGLAFVDSTLPPRKQN